MSPIAVERWAFHIKVKKKLCFDEKERRIKTPAKQHFARHAWYQKVGGDRSSHGRKMKNLGRNNKKTIKKRRGRDKIRERLVKLPKTFARGNHKEEHPHMIIGGSYLGQWNQGKKKPVDGGKKRNGERNEKRRLAKRHMFTKSQIVHLQKGKRRELYERKADRK